MNKAAHGIQNTTLEIHFEKWLKQERVYSRREKTYSVKVIFQMEWLIKHLKEIILTMIENTTGNKESSYVKLCQGEKRKHASKKLG